MADQKVRVYRQRSFHVVHLIFFILLIYLVIIIVQYMTRETIKVAEVVDGTLTQNHNYTGIALRTEKIVKAERTGYLKCYAADGSKVSKGSSIFALDAAPDTDSKSDGEAELTAQQSRTIQKYLKQFVVTYDNQKFSDLYSFEKQLDSTLNGLKQRNIDAVKDEESDSLHTATWSGIIYFTLDGLEQRKASEFTRKGIESLAIDRTSYTNGDEIVNGSSVCKIISKESWEILVPITADDYEYYKERETARVYLTDLGVYETCGIKIITDADGGYFADLTLNDYMEAYSNDRVVGLQLCKNVITGLKIPKTSIVSHELYVIPVKYASVNDSSTEFYRRDENGRPEKLSLSISYKDDNYYYIDDEQLQKGDMILEVVKKEEDSTEGSAAVSTENAAGSTEGSTAGSTESGTESSTESGSGNSGGSSTGSRIEVTSNFYTVGKKETLKGVFNINKGYAVFVAVEVLDENDTYCIVRSGTRYGLTIYDHIVLNASTVNEDDLLY